ncbi:MoaD/ThiS family protein [Sinanaerobacter chloroacetimidivorans]|uniref:MoaD/ThiS family protein n=1 Tax=Sinanaerobacter chloroacetimidivorans TaxID=2818044 RepID=A0A8J8B1A7_9FIRM|nr:MoaD/ThiS family protein [Sinanaerobacter chloroacetimidivorans]MBR0597461.1 MoaD/ThiS family protein [Sinanaerobacter chloroacetimidivorans]
MAILLYQLGIFNEMPSKVFMDADYISLRNGLELLQQQYHFPLEEIITEEGKLHHQLVILINGVSIDKAQGLETFIRDGDKVLLTGLVSGG